MKRDRVFPLRISATDEFLIESLQAKTGVASQAEIWRMSLRCMAKEHKIRIPKAAPERKL